MTRKTTDTVSNIKPAKYDEIIAEIKNVDDELSKRGANHDEYIKKLNDELSFVKNELRHATDDRDEAKSEEEYEKADERVKHFTVKRNYLESQIEKALDNALSKDEYDHYKEILLTDYTIALSDLRAKAFEKCEELMQVCALFNVLLEETNRSTHTLNDCSDFDYFDMSPEKLNIHFNDEFYNRPGDYRHILNAISRKQSKDFELFCISNMKSGDLKKMYGRTFN